MREEKEKEWGEGKRGGKGVGRGEEGTWRPGKGMGQDEGREKREEMEGREREGRGKEEGLRRVGERREKKGGRGE